MEGVARIKIHIFGANQIPLVLVYYWTTLLWITLEKEAALSAETSRPTLCSYIHVESQETGIHVSPYF
jgi:hypothetical protein